jgi:hypothetical protein
MRSFFDATKRECAKDRERPPLTEIKSPQFVASNAPRCLGASSSAETKHHFGWIPTLLLIFHAGPENAKRYE